MVCCTFLVETTFTSLSIAGTVGESDALIDKQYGQDVIDSLSVLEAVAPLFDPALWPRLVEILPILDLALRSRFAIIRQAAARCFATICHVMTAESMCYVVEKIVPLLSDPLTLANRQGATELIYRTFIEIIAPYIAETRCQILFNGWTSRPCHI